MDLFGFIEEFTKGAPAKKSAAKKVVPAKKVVAVKPSAVKKGPVAPPPIVQNKVEKIIAYHADTNQPVPTPKRFMIVATFSPIFITAQNKRVATTMAPSPEVYFTTMPPEIMTTIIPSEEIQFVTTYTPSPIELQTTAIPVV